MDRSKLSQSLIERLEHARPGEILDLVVELPPRHVAPTPGLSPEERIAPVREAFEREAAPVATAIRLMGGEVLGMAWINQTIRARVPAEGVSHLARMDEVVILDLPRTLWRDGG